MTKGTKDLNEQLVNFTRSNDIDNINYCLKNGAYINYRDKFRSTPLFYSVVNGNCSIAQYLLKNGADVKLLYRNEGNLLNAAIDNYGRFYFYTDIVELLISSGIEINHQDRYGNTPLWYACTYYRRNIAIIELLLNNGAYINIVNEFGSSIYSSAKSLKEHDLVELLEKYDKG